MTHLLIVSLSRSGGKLLRTLLDGHPELNALPFEHWNRPSKNKIPTKRIERFETLPTDLKLDTAGAAHAERKMERLHPRELVRRVMDAWRADAARAASLPDMYASLAHAYFPEVGRHRDAIVVNHCGSLSRFARDQVDAVFGRGTHILTIRDPRAVFTSMQGLLGRKFASERARGEKVSDSALERHLEKLETIDSVSGYLREFCGDYKRMVAEYAAREDVVRIRFEDLVMSPERTMRQIAARLAIRWDPILLDPTQLGRAHSPNSSFSRRGAAIHERAADDWTARIAPPVRSFIEDTLADEMAALGYQRLGDGSPTVLDSAPLLQGA